MGTLLLGKELLKMKRSVPTEVKVPTRKSALKRIRADKKRYIRNQHIINDIKTRVKNLRSLIAQKKADEARSALSMISSKLDKAAQKKIIHKNKASRTIARLTKAIKRLGTA